MMNAIIFRTSAFLRLSLLGPILVAVLFVAQLASVGGETEVVESGVLKDQVPAASFLLPDHGWGVPAPGASFEVDSDRTLLRDLLGTGCAQEGRKANI